MNREGNVKNIAMRLSCNQDIASNGAFSLGMISEFEDNLSEKGMWWYRRMFWYVN